MRISMISDEIEESKLTVAEWFKEKMKQRFMKKQGIVKKDL